MYPYTFSLSRTGARDLDQAVKQSHRTCSVNFALHIHSCGNILNNANFISSGVQVFLAALRHRKIQLSTGSIIILL